MSRYESPELENTASQAIETAFKRLVGECHLYQKVTVDLKPIEAILHEAYRAAALDASRPNFGSGSDRYPAKVTPERIASFNREIEARPWTLTTRHKGDDEITAKIYKSTAIGSAGIGAKPEELPINFYAPPVRLKCVGSCKTVTMFTPLASSGGFRFDCPFPRRGPSGVEQVFVVYYRCGECHETIFTVVVRRLALRLHLCGFAPRREYASPEGLPENIAQILGEAEQAVAEGDIHAGFYHLRTLIEHHVKQRLDLNLSDQIRGDEVLDRYNQDIELKIREVLPSLRPEFESLSSWLHARSGKVEDFGPTRDRVIRHIRLLGELEKSD